VLDRRLIEKAQGPRSTAGAPVRIEEEINNTDRSAGAMLSGSVAKIYGHTGLPLDTIQVNFKGTAGPGVRRVAGTRRHLRSRGRRQRLRRQGACPAGRIIVKPPRNSGIVPEESIIVGKQP